jgi:hypothetical protein
VRAPDGEAALEQAVAELELGTPRRIADFLYEHGVQGECGMMRTCAAAVYLSRRTGRVITVSGRSVWVSLSDSKDVRLPDVVRAFVWDFDAGRFPELVTPPSP